MKKSGAGVYILVVLAMLFWGLTFVVFKIAYESFRPITIVALRLFVSIFFLFSFAFLLKRLIPIRRKDQKWFILMAIFEPFFYFIGESFGLTLVTATVGAVIIATIPLVVPFASYYLFREKLSLMNYLGLALSFVGVLLVVLNKNGGLQSDGKGVALMFLAVVSAVGYTMLARKLIDHYNPITITSYQSLYGLILFLPWFLFLELPHLELKEASTKSILAIAYLGVFGSGLSFIFFTTGIRELGAARANIFTNLIPVITAVASFFLLKEAMPLVKILGILIVLAGLLLSQVNSLKVKWPSGKGRFRHIPNS